MKEYRTFVRIHDPPAELRPGLSARVQIQSNLLDDVLQVPVQAIYEHSPSEHYCVVRTSSGWETRPVRVVATNDFAVVIDDASRGIGLQEDEEVAMNPRRVIDHDSLPESEDHSPQAIARPDHLLDGESITRQQGIFPSDEQSSTPTPIETAGSSPSGAPPESPITQEAPLAEREQQPVEGQGAAAGFETGGVTSEPSTAPASSLAPAPQGMGL